MVFRFEMSGDALPFGGAADIVLEVLVRSVDLRVQ
jgi:hypothetical protein